MKVQWLQSTILRAASLLAPGEQRAEWLAGWRSELWYIPRRGATRFCVGAFRDALWLRRNHSSPITRRPTCLESPGGCLAFLVTLAALSLLILFRLPATHMAAGPHVRVRDLPDGLAAMLILSSLLLPAARWTLGQPPANPKPAPWPNRVCRGGFLALKIALVQPVMLCGFVVLLWILPVFPIAPQAGIGVSWMLTFRWLLADQRGRCPVCLHQLTNPVRIGTASQTFLEWYGAESCCSRGHGLLQISEISRNSEWLTLDDSWRGLFSKTAGAREL